MKTIIFILLKLLEISAVIFVPWGVGHIWKASGIDVWHEYWGFGVWIIGIFFLVLIAISLIQDWIHANKRLAEKIAERMRR